MYSINSITTPHLLCDPFHFWPVSFCLFRNNDMNLLRIAKDGFKSANHSLRAAQNLRAVFCSVSFYDYIRDRFSRKFAMPSLANLIRIASQRRSPLLC